MNSKFETNNRKGTTQMKRKALITFMSLCLSLTIVLSITACGKQTQQQQNQAEPTEQKEETEQSEQSEEVYNTEQLETETTETTDEITDNIVYPDVNPEDVDPKTTNMDGDTAIALGKQERAEICDKYGSVEAYDEYVKSQGADGSMGWCWVYDTGKGAGSEESYAVYMKEGSARYGEVFHLGDYLPNGTLFTGANNDEMSTADNRVLLRMSENGELGGTTVTQDENGMLNIVVE